MDKILGNLNEEQIKPVRDTEGAVLVLAGAGSGKTRVLISRIAYILQNNLATLSQILAITFTNKAANEMKERLFSALGEGESRWICTIHSMCVKILRDFADRAGLKPNFSIYSETERANVIKKCFRDLDFDEEGLLKDAKRHIANAKMLGLSPDEYYKKHHYERNIDDVISIYESYEAHLKKSNALDFDDLLLRTLKLLKEDEYTRGFLSDKFKYILVDEFQDTNSVQYNIIKLLASKHGNLFAVGDDDQSIYGWRGAELDNILKFDKDFGNAKVYKLERNYRSTKSILNLANSIISNNVQRRGKTLWTQAEEGANPVVYQADEEAGEALFTARTVQSAVLRGKKYSDFAVLMRINALTRPYEQEFTKYGIPYKVFGGFRFFERREIKDVLAYMRLISNPFDSEACERIINVPRRGIGSKTIEAMYEYAGENGTLYDALLDSEKLPLPRGVKSKLADFCSLIRGFVYSSLEKPVKELVRDIIDLTDLRAYYDDGSDEGAGKLSNLDEFLASVDDFSRLNPEATLDEYLNSVTLSSDLDDMDDGDYVTLATIHAVKGLEFPCVFICGLEKGIMPSSRSEGDGRDMEEERRLMYVAITRAEKELYLTRSKSRFLYGHRELTSPSKFLTELAPALGLKLSQPVAREAYRRADYGEKSYGRALYTEDDGVSFAAKSAFKPAFGAPLPQKQASPGGYSVGMKVKHPKFGAGTVIAVKNDGKILNVAFEGQGIKELAAAIAPLTKL